MAEQVLPPPTTPAPAPEPAAPGKIRAALVSVAVNLFLILLKGVVGFLAGSIGLIAEAVHSLTDLTASVLAVWGIRRAEQPPDVHHAFGHARYENLSSLLQMLIIGVASGILIYESILRIVNGFTIDVQWWAFAVMGGSVAVDLATSRYLNKAAGESGGSAALEADSFHFISDMWGAVAVIVGLIFAALGFKLADPIAAISVALVISGTAIRSGVRTTGILLDKAPPKALLDRIREVAASHPGVQEVRELRARVAGKRVLLDIAVGLDPAISIQEAHTLAHDVSTAIQREVPEVMDAVVHAEPVGAEHQADKRA
ncbi:MAG TPA: cation diffusion facilitator family transporter [Ktedonobacterales bacterium]|nr:cation diffusion facilitator family transporter [Ktedonobacterales bacterium]